MKTNSKRRTEQGDNAKNGNDENFYVTLPSTLNYAGESEEDEQSLGYPDFYEDTDNMNRYLW